MSAGEYGRISGEKESVYFISNPKYLIGSMCLIGVAWASILSMPYAILSGSPPAARTGVYTGVFNFFIVIPEIVQALTFGSIIRTLFGTNNPNSSLYMVIAGDTTESGAPALFEKLPVFRQIAERRPELPRFYKAMIDLRKSSIALRRGDLTWLKNSDDRRILTFTRKSRNEEILAAIDMSNQPFAGLIEASGNFEEITPGSDKAKAAATITPATLMLDAYGYRIFSRKN